MPLLQRGGGVGAAAQRLFIGKTQPERLPGCRGAACPALPRGFVINSKCFVQYVLAARSAAPGRFRCNSDVPPARPC